MSLLLAVLLAAAVADYHAPLAPSAFRDRLAAAVGRKTGKPTTIVDENTFKATDMNGTDLTISIDNVYRQYLANPDQIDAVMDRFVRVLVDGHRSTPRIADLVVIVRPTDYIIRTLPPGASTKNFISARPLAGDLSYFAAIDSPDTIRPVGPTDLAEMKIDEATAWARAIANTKAHIGPLELTRLGGDNGATGLFAASGLAPSVLADPSTCGDSSPNGVGKQVVLVYARDLFLFAVPSDRQMVRVFWETAKQEITAGRSMSATPVDVP